MTPACLSQRLIQVEDQTMRRGILLLYATAVLYFFYAPWNYFLLGILLLKRQSTKNRR
jgi:hypothetical protein